MAHLPQNGTTGFDPQPNEYLVDTPLLVRKGLKRREGCGTPSNFNLWGGIP